MNRRWAGATVMVAAAVALLIVSRTDGRGEPGVAIAVPPVPIPADGACLVAGIDEPAWTEIPCGETHSAEVIAARRTPPPGPNDERFDESGSYRGAFGLCDDFGDVRVPQEQGWGVRTPPLVAQEVTVGGPRGWTGCVITPVNGNGERTDYVGSAVAATSAEQVPPSLRLCFASGPVADPGPRSVAMLAGEQFGPAVACEVPHQWEVVAELQTWDPGAEEGTADPGAAERTDEQCRTVAHRAVGSKSAFIGDRALQVARDPETATTGSYSIPPISEPANSYAFITFGSGLYCSVGAPVGWLLTDSVVGIDDARLPLVRR